MYAQKYELAFETHYMQLSKASFNHILQYC